MALRVSENVSPPTIQLILCSHARRTVSGCSAMAVKDKAKETKKSNDELDHVTEIRPRSSVSLKHVLRKPEGRPIRYKVTPIWSSSRRLVNPDDASRLRGTCEGKLSSAKSPDARLTPRSSTWPKSPRSSIDADDKAIRSRWYRRIGWIHMAVWSWI